MPRADNEPLVRQRTSRLHLGNGHSKVVDLEPSVTITENIADLRCLNVVCGVPSVQHLSSKRQAINVCRREIKFAQESNYIMQTVGVFDLGVENLKPSMH